MQGTMLDISRLVTCQRGRKQVVSTKQQVQSQCVPKGRLAAEGKCKPTARMKPARTHHVPCPPYQVEAGDVENYVNYAVRERQQRRAAETLPAPRNVRSQIRQCKAPQCHCDGQQQEHEKGLHAHEEGRTSKGGALCDAGNGGMQKKQCSVTCERLPAVLTCTAWEGPHEQRGVSGCVRSGGKHKKCERLPQKDPGRPKGAPVQS